MPETPLDGTDEQWDEGWERTLRVNVLEPASLVREAVNHFIAQRRRHADRAVAAGPPSAAPRSRS